MKDFRVPLEDQIVARLSEITELEFVAAATKVGLSKPTAWPAVTVTYEGFRKIGTPVQFGTAQHTNVELRFFITLATHSGAGPARSERGPDGAPALLSLIFEKLSGFLLDLGEEFQTSWPCEVEDEIPYEINGQVVSWQQTWSAQIQLPGFTPA